MENTSKEMAFLHLYTFQVLPVSGAAAIAADQISEAC